MKIRPVGADLFPAVEQTEMPKQRVVFLNYTNVPKNDYFLIQNHVVRKSDMYSHSTIPTRGENTNQSSAPDDGHIGARNMLSNL